jgi:hypothetical protein
MLDSLACSFTILIQFQIWDWRENVVKSYKKVWENAVDCIAEKKRRYKIHVSYTIKMKCCDGSYDNPDGMVEVYLITTNIPRCRVNQRY